MGDGTDTKALPTELEHFRHEEYTVNTAVLIQSRQDFLLATDLYKIAGAKTRQYPSHAIPVRIVSIELILVSASPGRAPTASRRSSEVSTEFIGRQNSSSQGLLS